MYSYFPIVYLSLNVFSYQRVLSLSSLCMLYHVNNHWHDFSSVKSLMKSRYLLFKIKAIDYYTTQLNINGMKYELYRIHCKCNAISNDDYNKINLVSSKTIILKKMCMRYHYLALICCHHHGVILC